MKRGALLVFVLVIFVAAGIRVWMRTSPAPRGTPAGAVEAPPASEAGTPPAPSPTATVRPAPEPSARPAKASPKPRKFDLVKDAPRLEEVREEIRENPHGVPPSMQVMAQVMAGKMKDGLASEEGARQLMPELTDCSRESPILTVRQLCLVNARRLAHKYPALASDFERAVEATTPDTRRALDELAPRRD